MFGRWAFAARRRVGWREEKTASAAVFMAEEAMKSRPEFWTSFTVMDPRGAPEQAKKLEADGWDGAVMYDSQCMFPEVWTFLATCAQTTQRIKLTTGVTNPVTRHPSVTASAAASLQLISGGRSVLGVGRGDSALAYVGASPMPLSAYEHYLETLQTYLRGDEVAMADASAMVVNAKAGFENLAMGSAPPGSRLKWLAQYDMPKVPLEAFATGPRVIASSARTAETVILGMGAEINRIAWGADLARTAAAEAGREGIGVGCVVTAVPHENVQIARKLARPTVAPLARFSVMNNKVVGPATASQAETMLKIAKVYDMNRHGGEAMQTSIIDDEFVDQFAIVGSVETCVDRLNELVALGIDRMTLSRPPLLTNTDQAHSYALLVNEVLPKVRAS